MTIRPKGRLRSSTTIVKHLQTEMKKAPTPRETQTLRIAYAGGVRPPSLYQI